MKYATGLSGFLGSHLNQIVSDIVGIPHEQISSVKLQPYDSFFFLSTYGNMAGHNEIGLLETSKVIKGNISDLISILDQTDFIGGIKSFVFVSSSSVKLKTHTTYSRAKRAAEEILLAYMEKYNAPIAIVRPFSITGVGEQDKHLIPTLIRSCYTGAEMPFVPDAQHDFIDVSDVAGGIKVLSDAHAKGIFELGSGKSYSNQEVKEIVERVSGKKANTRFVSNMRSYDNKDWVSRNFTARQYGWEPKKSLEQSITEMVKDYEKKLTTQFTTEKT